MTEQKMLDPASMNAEQTPKSKPRRLNKEINMDKKVLTIEVIGGQKGVITFNPKELKDPAILEYLPLLALNHRLGDAAAGRSGVDAEKAIVAVWEGLKKGELTVRAPAKPKVAVEDVKTNLEKLSPAERKAAEAVLKSLGIPGF